MLALIGLTVSFAWDWAFESRWGKDFKPNGKDILIKEPIYYISSKNRSRGIPPINYAECPKKTTSGLIRVSEFTCLKVALGTRQQDTHFSDPLGLSSV